MKIVRASFGLSLALLAAAPAWAAVAPPKPPAPGGADQGRDQWRGRAVEVCVIGMRGTDGASAAEIEATCGCAADRLLARWPGVSPPPLPLQDIRTLNSGDLLACAADQRPELVAAVARRETELAMAGAQPPAAADAAKPADSAAPAPAPPEAPKRDGPDLRARLDSLSLPAWITDSGLPAWAWLVLAMLAFLLLRGLFRRNDRRDLIGPPPGMRLGQRPPQPQPRRPEPPQRP